MIKIIVNENKRGVDSLFVYVLILGMAIMFAGFSSGLLINNVSYTPNDNSTIDPGVVISVQANVTSSNSIENVSFFVYYSNGTIYNESEMVLISPDIYNASFTTPGIEDNLTLYVYANDSVDTNLSTNITMGNLWDCSWNVSYRGLTGASALGYYENKVIGNITIFNLGDIEHSDCNINFSITYDGDSLSDDYWGASLWAESDIGLIFPGDSGIFSQQLNVSSNYTFNVTAAYPADILEESTSVIITSNISDSLDGKTGFNVSVNMTIAPPGPYLVSGFEIYSSPIYLTDSINNSFIVYLENIAGDDTDARIAYNVSFNWTLPSYFLNNSGELIPGVVNLSNNSRAYYNLSALMDSSALTALSPGTINVSVYIQGYQNTSSGMTLINFTNNSQVLVKTVEIDLECYGYEDDIVVSACGSLDGDYNTQTTVVVGSGGSGGGGGGGGGGASVGSVDKIDYVFVRGQQSEIVVPFKNKGNESLIDLNFSVSGDIAKYIEIIPGSVDELDPGEEIDIILKVLSPSYLKIGTQEITLLIKGRLGYKNYESSKKINLQVTEISEEKANELVNEMKRLIGEIVDKNLSTITLDPLLEEAIKGLNEKHYEKIVENYAIVEKNVNDVLGALKIIDILRNAINDANEKGIKVSGTERLLKLALLSLNRGDYEQAALRAKEAQLTFASETKGELASLSYYLNNNKEQIIIGLAFLLVVSFTGYKFGKLQYIRRRIRKLRNEEYITTQLIKMAQEETFKKKRMEMDEYNSTIDHYEKKMAELVEKLIDLENEEEYVFSITRESKRLVIQRQRIISFIKGIQEDYMKKGKMDAKVYELKLKSYEKRLGEIDARIAEEEAKEALSKFQVFR